MLAAQPEGRGSPRAPSAEGVIPRAFTVFFAARLGPWAIALSIVVAHTRPIENVRHEPWLLLATLLWIALGVAYVPYARSWLSARLGFNLGGRTDLLAVAALDQIFAFVVVLLSGGLNTPYYHFAVTALLIPAFILGWRSSLAAMAGFLATMIISWSVVGGGVDGWLRREQFGGPIPGLLITPALVMLVARYMASLASGLERGYERAKRGLEDTQALYNVARVSAAASTPADLASDALWVIAGMQRFQRLVVSEERGGDTLPLADTNEPAAMSATWTAPPGSREGSTTGTLHLATPDGRAAELDTLPLYSGDELLGALSFESVGPLTSSDTLLLRAIAEQLATAFANLRLAAEKDLLVAAEERARIAREIHDGVAQSLFMLALHLDKTAALVDDDPVLGERIRLLLWMAREALVEVREYIFDLKPLLAGQVSLTQTIRDQASEFSRVAGVAIGIEVEGAERELPIHHRGALFRVVQEAFANAYRHGDANRIDVLVTFADDSVAIEVRDNGRGFSVLDPPGTGLGLRNMRERVAEVGGTVEIDSEPGGGTTVRVHVRSTPLNPPPTAEQVKGAL